MQHDVMQHDAMQHDAMQPDAMEHDAMRQCAAKTMRCNAIQKSRARGPCAAAHLDFALPLLQRRERRDEQERAARVLDLRRTRARPGAARVAWGEEKESDLEEWDS
jgi:hypothetical protein